MPNQTSIAIAVLHDNDWADILLDDGVIRARKGEVTAQIYVTLTGRIQYGIIGTRESGVHADNLPDVLELIAR